MTTVRAFASARYAYVLAALSICLLATSVHAKSLTGTALVTALRHGGYVIVMRHPSSPPTVPDKAQADPGNTRLERQLDDAGRKTAREMGDAFRRLHIPVGQVLSSPTYRAREAVRLAAFGEPKTFSELDEGAQGMKANADAERSAWLRKAVTKSPAAGKNTVIVTHTPNIVGAFGPTAKGVAAGEAFVFQPNGSEEPEIVARIKIEEWPQLAGMR